MPATAGIPHVGDVVFVGRAASVQFTGRGFNLRVIEVVPPAAYSEFCWLYGYQLDPAGNATDRRDIYVRFTGLRPARPFHQPRRAPLRSARETTVRPPSRQKGAPSMEPEPPPRAEIQRREALMDRAVTVLSAHVPDPAGWCSGCLNGWDRAVPSDNCASRTWALRVAESAAASPYDQPTSLPRQSDDLPLIEARSATEHLSAAMR